MSVIKLGLLKEEDVCDYLNKEFFARFGENLFPTKKELVLDVGCGDAKVVKHLDTESYIGLDKNMNTIENLSSSSWPNCRFIQASVSEIPLQENVANVILSLGFAFWQVENGISEVKRILKPDGKLVIRASQYYTLGVPIKNILIKSGFLVEEHVVFDFKCRIGNDIFPTSFSYLILSKDDKGDRFKSYTCKDSSL